MFGTIDSLRLRWRLYHQRNAAQNAALERAKILSTMPDSIVLYGWNSYSQCDEDGVIQEALRRIGTITPLSKTFIEVGCGAGIENNTHQLVLNEFRGCWIDGDKKKIDRLRSEFPRGEKNGLLIAHQFLSKESIRVVMSDCVRFLQTSDLDIFSLDVDGNDLHFVRDALDVVKPKLLCVEYNAKFPPPIRLAMEYSAEHRWDSSDYFGASLQSWIDALDGYTLVACNISGVNAFFVRNDLTGPFTIYPPSALYQPPRYWLVGQIGHPASLHWLRNVLGR